MEQKEPSPTLEEAIGEVRRPDGSVDVRPENREVVFSLVTKGTFTEVDRIAIEVTTKGKEGKKFGAPTRYVKVLDRGPEGTDYFSAEMTVVDQPEEISVGGAVVGYSTVSLTMHNSVNQISFHRIGSGQTIVRNDNIEGSERLLDTPNSLFIPLPTMKMYPAGNPMTWISEVVHRDILKKMREELSTPKG